MSCGGTVKLVGFSDKTSALRETSQRGTKVSPLLSTDIDFVMYLCYNNIIDSIFGGKNEDNRYCARIDEV